VLIADQFYHAAAVLGAPAAEWPSLDLVAIHGRALVDGAEKNAGRGGELLVEMRFDGLPPVDARFI
jgi:hypothetical protein